MYGISWVKSTSENFSLYVHRIVDKNDGFPPVSINVFDAMKQDVASLNAIETDLVHV